MPEPKQATSTSEENPSNRVIPHRAACPQRKKGNALAGESGLNDLRSFAFTALITACICAACSTEAPLALQPPAEPAASIGEPLDLSGSTVCAIEADCTAGKTCFQSACVVGGPELSEVEPGLTILDPGSRLIRVAAGETTERVSILLSGPPPAGGLPYRIERSDEPDVESAVELATGSGNTVNITLATGAANPEVEGAENPIYVNVLTAAGAARYILVPELPVDGTYQGEAVLGTFGQLGLPIEVSIVTDPPGADLQVATAAYLVLPIEAGNLFNPLPPTTSGPTFVTRPLEYDEFVSAWVARFDMPYVLGDESAFNWVDVSGNAVARRMRFEITPIGDGVMAGRFSDRWSGLLEVRSPAGVLEPEAVVFEGSVTLERIAAAPALADVTPPVEYPTEAAGTLPMPVLDQCMGVSFTASVSIDGRSVDCGVITDAQSFEAASPVQQSECALAMTQVALDAGTTASQIEDFLDDSTPNPGGISFSEFMRRCTAQIDGTCLPSPTLLCSRQLAAHAVKVAPEGSPDLLDLVRNYQDTTREAFLGRQFGAFYADAQTRLDWLEAQDYPAIVTAAVQSFVAELLQDWQDNVLEAHVGVIQGQFDPSGVAVLGQSVLGDPDALSAQRQLLLEATQSWRSASEAFALGATRWGALLTDPVDRSDKATYVYDRTVDLYVVAGLLAEQNRRAGAGGNNAMFAGGFRPLLSSTRQLALPFDRLIYERQGEVVVSTSLDPTSGNELILSGLRADAIDEVDRASESVTAVIADAQAELLQQAELTGQIANDTAELEAELVDLCGLPIGCDRPDRGTCAPRIQAGECGFNVDPSGMTQDGFPPTSNPSEAGAAILEVRGTLLEVQRAEEAVRAHAAQTQLYFNTTQRFADQVQAWNQERLALVSAIDGKIGELLASRDAAVGALANGLQRELGERNRRITEQVGFVEQWRTIRVNGAEEDFKDRMKVIGLRATAAGLDALAEAIDDKAKALIEGLPRSTGQSNDTTFAARMTIWMAKYYVTKAMKVAALGGKVAANYLDAQIQKAQDLRQAQLSVLELQNDVGASQSMAILAMVRGEAELIVTATELEQEIVLEIVSNMERDVDAALAYERDLVELRDRRDEVQARIIENDELHIAVSQAELTVEQAMSNYARVVQRAQLLSGRLAMLRTQLDNVNQLLGSPSAVFAWANKLTRAENRLERAKGVLMDWVVALEYFAVRPFFDARIQILLARNTTQLEAIAQDLERIQAQCGGAQNNQVVEVSVRNDLLGINRPVVDLQTGAPLSPAERFRDLMTEARVPIDKRVRYQSDATVGDLLTRGGVLAVTFDIGMNEFANLANTCNAKVKSLAIQLVGDGLGEGLPTVSVLYDGTSRLRSCQPDITAIVELVGADVTPFSEVTEFKTPGRSVSPVAGINAFTADGNISLGGLPLVSQYTVLIDPEAGENGRIDWAQLDDVKLRVEYTYQDLFPAGQCQ